MAPATAPASPSLPVPRKAAISGDDGVAVLAVTTKDSLRYPRHRCRQRGGGERLPRWPHDRGQRTRPPAIHRCGIWRERFRVFPFRDRTALHLPARCFQRVRRPGHRYLVGGRPETRGRADRHRNGPDHPLGAGLGRQEGGVRRGVETQALYLLASEEGLIEIRSLVDDSVLHRFTELQTALGESKASRPISAERWRGFDPSFRTLLGHASPESTSSSGGIRDRQSRTTPRPHRHQRRLPTYA